SIASSSCNRSNIVALLRFVWVCPAFGGRPTASRELGAEGVEVPRPHVAEPLHPGVHIAHPRCLHCVHPPCALWTHRREAMLSQHPEVLRDRRLGDAELLPHGVDDLP